MQIAVSGKFSIDHSDTASVAAAKIRTLLQSTEIQSIDTNLESFVFFPVIISDYFGVEKKSYRFYSRKENAEFVSEEINVTDWEMADEDGRLILMVDALEKAVRGTRSGRLHDGAKEAIVGYVRRAVEANGS
ncbi:hypothetical protein [Novosphingobium sediminicola]|uniref:Uncharacterized protein n=1 Tax=Novosphingobium sediminicola TaxID=563162 RepID=A0A7W6CNF6_9SPHN|nr:hypothetical protein [Novosphingobium sediminicola]MBB3957844.1 hypothetical protein [Novosphingobium sediminicola]